MNYYKKKQLEKHFVKNTINDMLKMREDYKRYVLNQYLKNNPEPMCVADNCPNKATDFIVEYPANTNPKRRLKVGIIALCLDHYYQDIINQGGN